MTSEVLQILMSPDNPFFRLSTFGYAGSTHVSKKINSCVLFQLKNRSKPACRLTEACVSMKTSLKTCSSRKNTIQMQWGIQGSGLGRLTSSFMLATKKMLQSPSPSRILDYYICPCQFNKALIVLHTFKSYLLKRQLRKWWASQGFIHWILLSKLHASDSKDKQYAQFYIYLCIVV